MINQNNYFIPQLCYPSNTIQGYEMPAQKPTDSEKGTDFTSPVDSILTSAICLPNTDFFEGISISFP